MKYNNKIIQDDMQNIDNMFSINKIEKNLSIMVTGCNGMIATYLIYYFIHLNDKYKFNLKIYGITRNLKKSVEKYKDVLDRNDLEFINHDVNFEFDFDIKVDYIFHFASSADPNNILKNPVDIIKANTLGTINVMEYARKKNVKKVIFSSTREVYGKMNDDCELINEKDLGIIDWLGVRACYPESKKMGECIINSYNLQYNIPYTILRIAHSYGPGMPVSNDGRIMSDLINNVINNENIVLKSDGSAVRGFCYISDLISAIMIATFVGDSNSTYNICNEDENITILDLANKLVKLFPEKKLSVSYKKMGQVEKEAYCKFKRVKMDTNKIRSLGWMPIVDLDTGLKNTVNSFERRD